MNRDLQNIQPSAAAADTAAADTQPIYDNSNIFNEGGGLKLHFGIIGQLLDFVKDEPSALLRLYRDCSEIAHTDELYADAQAQILYVLTSQILDVQCMMEAEICPHHILYLLPEEIALLYHALVVGRPSHTFTIEEKMEQLSYTRHMWFTPTHAIFTADGYIKKEEMNMIHLLEHALENGYNNLIRLLQNDALLVTEFQLTYIYLKRNHHKNEHLYSAAVRAQPELLKMIRFEGSEGFQRLIKYAIAGVRQEFTDIPEDFDNYVHPNLDVVKFLMPKHWSHDSEFYFESANGRLSGNALDFWHAIQNFTYTWGDMGYGGEEMRFPYEKDESIRDYLQSIGCVSKITPPDFPRLVLNFLPTIPHPTSPITM